MSRSGLFNSTMVLYDEVETSSATGGVVTTLSLVGSYPCRYRTLNGQEENIGGKIAESSTHRVYCNLDVPVNSYSVMEIDNYTFKVEYIAYKKGGVTRRTQGLEVDVSFKEQTKRDTGV